MWRKIASRSGFTVAYGPSANVPNALVGVFATLHKEKSLTSLDSDDFTKRIAYYYSELDAIHPFREGNSRTLRAFTADLAREAGYTLDWSQIGSTDEARKRLYHARDLAVMRGDLSELTEIRRLCLTNQ